MENEGFVVAIIVGSLISAAFFLGLMYYFLRLWIRGPMKGSDNKRRLDGRVVVITGGNSGIGKATTRDLYRRGAEVVMLCRNLATAEKTADQIEKGSRDLELCDRGFLRIIHCDLASIKSVRACVQQLHQCYSQIDFLINNAGVMMCPNLKTVDGFDMQFGTNHLGHFLLTELLIPLILKSASTGFQPRIIVVSSTDHFRGQINWDDVNFKMTSKTMPYDPAKAYYQSKLANMMHANQLTNRLEGSGVSVFAVHPGATHTRLQRHLLWEWYGCFLYPFLVCFTKTPLEGAQTSLFCVLDESLDELTGGFYKECRQISPSMESFNETNCERLWILSEKLLGLRSTLSEML